MDSTAEDVEIIDLSIPCLPDYVGVVRLTISGIASRMNFSIEEIEDIKIAVSEACTNAVQYAYPDSLKKQSFIQIRSWVYPKTLKIQVKDTGSGFDTKEVAKGNRPEKTIESKTGPSLGLGLTFIKTLMDEAFIDSEQDMGTTITMAKHI